MKNFKKFLACFLTLACLVSQFSITGFAEETDYSAYENSDKIAEAIAALRTDSNLSLGYETDYSTLAAGKVYIEATTNGVKSGNKGNFYQSTYTNEGYQNNVFDGDISSAADVNVRDDSNTQITYLNEGGTYKENVYIDISTQLKYQADVERIFIAFRSEVHFQACEYEIYAANSYEDLYKSENRRFYYENQNGAQYQVFDFAEPINVKYIGIRILKGVTLPYPYGVESSYPRFAEIAFFGEYTDPTYIYDDVVSQANKDACVAALKSDYNLMQDGYVTGKADKPSYITITGKDNGTVVDGYGGFYSYGHGTADNAVFDGVLGASNADVNLSTASGPMVFVDSEGNAKPDTYIDISICLTHPAKIDKVFVANRNNAALMTYEYAVFASNSLDTLYDDANKKYHYENVLKAQYQTIPMDNTEVVNYVGIRIYKAVETPFTAYGPGAAYPRFEEIAVFGKYDLDYYDYTVNANIDDVISVSDSTYVGKAKSYSVPLISGEKIFKEWQINGNAVGCNINQYKGTATLDFTVNEKIDAVAVYEDIPSTLTSDKYAIDKENSLVRIPAYEVFHTASAGFNAYRGNVVATKGETRLTDGDYITPGTKLGIDNIPDSQLTVVAESDYNLDGEVNVTDITAAIQGIYAGTHSEDAMFTFDANNSGKITVSDIVLARNSVLNSEKYDFSEKTSIISQMEHKTMGRTVIEEDGSLYLDLTASGFSFNAYCYGDVKIELSKSTWFTVIVDGEEKNMLLGGSSKQTVTLAEGLSAGKHTIELYKQTEGDSSVNIYSVTLEGEILEAPENADLLIEFAGDSITCGYGNVVEADRVGGNRVTDGYKSYGAQTARKLGADWSNVSKSGAALINKEGMSNAHIPTVFKQKTFQNTDAYGFERKADIVVINLGTNDSGLMRDWSVEERKATFKAAAEDFVEEILQLNGADTKIVFGFGMMTAKNEFDEVYEELAAELQENGVDAFYCRLPTNTDGAVDHPSVAGDLAAAEVLSEFIKTNVLD